MCKQVIVCFWVCPGRETAWPLLLEYVIRVKWSRQCMRGFRGFAWLPPHRFNTLLKWNNLVSMRPHYLIFISQGHNQYKLRYISLEEVKIVSFQQWFQSEAIESNLFKLYLKLLRQGQILVRQKYNLFKLKSNLFSDFQWPRVQISRRCVHTFIV